MIDRGNGRIKIPTAIYHKNRHDTKHHEIPTAELLQRTIKVGASPSHLHRNVSRGELPSDLVLPDVVHGYLRNLRLPPIARSNHGVHQR